MEKERKGTMATGALMMPFMFPGVAMTLHASGQSQGALCTLLASHSHVFVVGDREVSEEEGQQQLRFIRSLSQRRMGAAV